jgi:Ca2+/Na+ antiporter
MDIFDEFWLFVRKYLFSILLILAGITCLIVGVTTNANADLAQSSYFVYGAIGLFLLGAMSLFFILQQKISRTITAIFSLLFVCSASLYLWLNIKTVKEEIVYQKEVKESITLAKQGLKDIQKLQDAYEKKYKKHAVNFDQLIEFAETDSITVLISAKGDLPTRKMTVEEGKQLGLRYPAEVWTEDFALRLNLPNFVREYAKIPVAVDLFEEKEKESREYPFSIEQLKVQRTIETDSTYKEFKFNNLYNPKDSTTLVIITSIPPYGPQKDYDVKEVYQIGSHAEKTMKTNWK